AALDRGRARLGLPRGRALPSLPASPLQEQLAYVCEARIPVVGFAMGDPAPFVARIKDGGGFVIAMACTVDDAVRLEAGGGDAFPAYRRRLGESSETDAVMTLAISGRPARALRNDLVRAVDGAAAPPLPWPYQAMAADDVYRAAVAADDADWAPLLAGQGLRL